MRPPPIDTRTNPFAHGTMRDRVPGILRETAAHAAAHADAAAAERLHALAASMSANGVIPPLTQPAPDYAAWMAAYLPHDGETWLNTEWWFAELYTYRLIIEYTRWYETRRDPFAPKKDAELTSPALWSAVAAALDDRSAADDADVLADRLLFALWGNRIDLSLEASKAHGATGGTADLLADDRAAALAALAAHPGGVVHYIADNTGSELALDLVLIDALLDGHCDQVVLHVKEHPTFVSDAIPADVSTLIALLAERRRTPLQALGDRLNGAILDQRLIVRPDWQWNSPAFLWQFPTDFLREQFTGAALTIIKGDANYRRMVGDALWPPETPFAAVVDYVPAPLLALRTLKSDPVVGLPPGAAAELDAADPTWRVNGKRGVIQFTPGRG